MTDTASPEGAGAKRNVVTLTLASALLGAQMPVHFTLGGLSGQVLATDKSLATLPITATVVVSMFAAPAIAQLMGRWGRIPGFLIGALGGGLGAALSALALITGSFALLLIGAGLTGVYMAAQGQYRFAATDAAPPALRPKAISLVMSGGLVSALLAPVIVGAFTDALEPTPFAGAYAALAALNILGAPLFLFLRSPRPKRSPDGRSGRSLREIMAQPRARAAVICAMVSYALMNLVMTATPLAVVACGYLARDGASVVMVHVLAMFAPSFVTGRIITRFGVERVIAAGLMLLAASGVVALSGLDIAYFYVALTLLGVGWNFGFIGATAMLAETHAPEERAKVQGFNDFLVFGLVVIASVSSGALLNGYGAGDVAVGWSAVNLAMVPFLALAAAALFWLRVLEGSRRASAG